MRIIKQYQDLKLLAENDVLGKDYLKEVRAYFLQLREALGRKINGELESLEEFSLKDHGYIVILEAGDNLRGEPMANIGLNPEGGLLVSFLEFVEEIELENISIYKISIMHNNDYMMNLYSIKGQHDGEIEEYLASHAETVASMADKEADTEVPF